MRVTPEELRENIERDIAYLRTVVEEPVSIKYGAHTSFQVRPDNDDDRVVVEREGWGLTTVNYTSEGVIVDVSDEGGAPVSGTQVWSEDLE